MSVAITEHMAKTSRHSTFFLAAGPLDGPLVIFCHGWPELSLSWRHTLPVFAALGFRAVAPDMRGYGRSSVYTEHEDYALEHSVADMLELLAHLGREAAVWVGHDWGAPVVWSLASHHPNVCIGVAGLCVPYWMLERGLEHMIQHVDRKMYPLEQFPAGQWEYMRFYEESFPKAQKQMESNVLNFFKALFTAGRPKAAEAPAMTAFTRKNGGWFGGPGRSAPDIPRDHRVVTEADLSSYVSAFERNGFFGPDSWYMNHAANAKYAETAQNGGTLQMPALFVAAAFDATCPPALGAEMHAHCEKLSIAVIKCGHWMAQEKPVELNSVLVRWLATEVSSSWPQIESPTTLSKL